MRGRQGGTISTADKGNEYIPLIPAQQAFRHHRWHKTLQSKPHTQPASPPLLCCNCPNQTLPTFHHHDAQHFSETTARLLRTQEKARLTALSAEMARVSKENSALLEELARLKAARAVAANTANESAPEGPNGGGYIVPEKNPSHQQVCGWADAGND